MEKSIDSVKEWARGHLQWYGQSAFRIRTDAGRTIFIDPYRVPAGAGPADLILVTHPHMDHYDRKSIEGLRGERTVVALPRSCAEGGMTGVAPGETMRLPPASVTGIHAYNLTKRFHPGSANWLGYMIEVEGVTVYHAGDTDLIPEMKDLRPDIALLPIGGFFSMGGRAAAEAALLLRATLAIPMHYGPLIGGRGAGARFAGRVGPGSLALPMERRGRMHIIEATR